MFNTRTKKKQSLSIFGGANKNHVMMLDEAKGEMVGNLKFTIFLARLG